MNVHEIIVQSIRGFESFLHLHLLLALLVYTFILVSQRKHFKHLKVQSFSKDKVPFDLINAPRVTVLIPAYNEGSALFDTIEAAISSDYPNLEVVVIDDGSTDDTFALVRDNYKLSAILGNEDQSSRISLYSSERVPKLRLINKPHTGKADSLNTGIKNSTGEFICCLDGDSIILPDSLPKLITKFINEPSLVALGGAIAPSNQLSIRGQTIVRHEARSNLLERIQVVEYLRSFTLWRTGWSYIDGLLIISGAMTVFTREALLNIGGYNSDTDTEDLDVILRLHQYYCYLQRPYHIWTIPNVICWTRAPRTLKQLRSQRIRWMVGALQCITKNRRLLCTNQNVVLGWFALPHLIFIEVFAPVIELVGLCSLLASAFVGVLSYQSVIIYGFLVYALTGFYSWNSIYAADIYFKNFSTLAEDLKIGLVGLVEPIGYRQLDSVWRMIGWWKWLRNSRITWK